jgi:release factor glutamine methyltransferase
VTQPGAPELAAIVSRLRAAGCVFAEDEANLLCSAARTPAELSAMVERRVSGLPLEHVLGWAEFCGQRVAVASGVFVPRRRSEFLVRQAVAAASSWPSHPGRKSGSSSQPDRGPTAPVVILDLCCGSGAVGVAVAAGLDHAELHAADIDPAAVACARQNVTAVGGRVYQGDLYDPLPASLRGRVDVLVVNAPYVPTSEIALMPPEARLHEPAIALDGGADGVDIHRRVAASALSWLAAPSGRLLIETSDRQVPLTVAAMAAAGLATQVARDDDLGAAVVIGSAGRRR